MIPQRGEIPYEPYDTPLGQIPYEPIGRIPYEPPLG